MVTSIQNVMDGMDLIISLRITLVLDSLIAEAIIVGICTIASPIIYYIIIASF